MSDIYIQAEVAAIAYRVKQLFGTIPQKYDFVPEDFVRPAIYFEPLRSTGSVFSNKKYRKAHTLSIKIFQADEAEANRYAASVAEAIHCDIMDNRHLVRMIDNDGNLINNYIRILTVETRPMTNTAHTVVMTWNSLYDYTIPAADLMAILDVTTELEE
ncbi:MAG: phage tail terminator family protein [Sphaerochaetaceae bacterium]